MQILLLCGIAYLLGSIPFGYICGRAVRNIDIRQHGSQNIGATNVFRVLGKKWGVTVFTLDAAKGYAAVLASFFLSSPENLILLKMLLGLCAILGHTFPVWLSFRGGKGVATSLGVFLNVCPYPALLSFIFWIFTFFLSRIISVASLAAALSFPLCVFFLQKNKPSFALLFTISIGLAAFIFYTHRKNIKRILDGNEKKMF